MVRTIHNDGTGGVQFCDCCDSNPVNTGCPGCPHPQFMDIDLVGSFPFNSGSQDLRWTSGSTNWEHDAGSAAAVQAALEGMLTTQWNFDSTGGCTYPDIIRAVTVNIPGEFNTFGGPFNVPGNMTEMRITGNFGYLVGSLTGWGFVVDNIEATIDGSTYPLLTAGGDALGPAIYGIDLNCADRGNFPTLFANSGGIINGGTGVPFVVWTLTSVTMTEP